MIQILYIAIASVWFAELTNIPQRVKHAFGLKRFKPFDCPLCLAFWIQLGICISQNENYYYIPLTSFAACLIAMTINKVFK